MYRKPWQSKCSAKYIVPCGCQLNVGRVERQLNPPFLIVLASLERRVGRSEAETHHFILLIYQFSLYACCDDIWVAVGFTSFYPPYFII